METVIVCQAAEGFPVHFDKHAFGADHVLVVGRVKPHTNFVGDIESGLMKMMLIGLGKHEGAKIYHRAIMAVIPKHINNQSIPDRVPASYRGVASSTADSDDQSTSKVGRSLELKDLEGLFFGCSRIRFAEIGDGTSNTFMTSKSEYGAIARRPKPLCAIIAVAASTSFRASVDKSANASRNKSTTISSS